MPNDRAACKQQARCRHTAQPDGNRLAVALFLFRRLRRLHAVLRLLHLLLCEVKCICTGRLIGRMLHRRLVRRARLFRLRHVLLHRLLFCGLLFQRLLFCHFLRLYILRFRLLRLPIIITGRRRRIVVSEVVHCNGLPLDFVILF